MKKYLLILFIILISCFSSHAQNDQIVNARNVNIQISNPAGASGTIPWLTLSNQTYVLSPLTPDMGFCISVVNNNPTSQHSFSVAAFQSGDTNVGDYSNNTGRYTSLPVIISAGSQPLVAPAGTTISFFVKSNGAAKVAFKFTGASTQAGVPDTVDIYGVQTTSGTCGSVLSGLTSGNSSISANWVTSAPAASSQATATIVGIAGKRWILSCLMFGASATTAPALTSGTVQVLDNATPVWGFTLAVPASTGQLIPVSHICGLNIPITIGNNVTVQWSASIANLSETVGMTLLQQ